jgi:hypothetical protein
MSLRETFEHDQARARDTAAVLLVLAGLGAAIIYLLFAILTTTAQAGDRRNSTSLHGVVAPLADKARAIVAACGSKVVSSVRIGARVYGGNASNHARGRAVDLQGNPRCIYAQLKDWPGGVSIDYARAPGGPHVHVSYNPGGMEWGLRFNHRAPKKKFPVTAATMQQTKD